jgi:hypothetical protein
LWAFDNRPGRYGAYSRFPEHRMIQTEERLTPNVDAVACPIRILSIHAAVNVLDQRAVGWVAGRAIRSWL